MIGREIVFFLWVVLAALWSRPIDPSGVETAHCLMMLLQNFLQLGSPGLDASHLIIILSVSERIFIRRTSRGHPPKWDPFEVMIPGGA